MRAEGFNVGLRTELVPDLDSTLSFWLLDLDSELLFIGDAGTTDAGRPSRRYGVEWSNYYRPLPWLTFDADFSFSKARFSDDDPAGDHIPGAIETVIAAGVTIDDLKGFFGGCGCVISDPGPSSRTTACARHPPRSSTPTSATSSATICAWASRSSTSSTARTATRHRVFLRLPARRGARRGCGRHPFPSRRAALGARHPEPVVLSMGMLLALYGLLRRMPRPTGKALDRRDCRPLETRDGK